MDDQVTELKNDLEKLKSSIQVQFLKLNKFMKEINTMYQQLQELNDSIRRDKATLEEVTVQQLVENGSPPSSDAETTVALQNKLEQKLKVDEESRQKLITETGILIADVDRLMSELTQSKEDLAFLSNRV